MVNFGKSKACTTCKRRRIKCDELKPRCARCTLASIPCEWLEPKRTLSLQFVDVTQTAVSHTSGTQVSRNRLALATPSKALADDREAQALAFFSRHYMIDQDTIGAPNPGLFGLFEPAVSTTFGNSSATRAVSALALSIYSRWRTDDGTTDKRVARNLSLSIGTLAGDLQKEESRRSDITLLTTLTLQFHSSFESLFSANKATIVHHLGALALVREFGRRESWSNLAVQFVAYILHVDVAAAIREHRRVHPELCRWSTIITASSLDPDSHLDALGIQVADIQFRISSLSEGLSSMATDALLNEVQKFDDCLILWHDRVCQSWGPFQWFKEQATVPPIQTFDKVCHVYTSIRAARLLNIWRSYRLTLSYLSLQIINGQQHSRTRDVDESTRTEVTSFLLVKRIQQLVDGVCASVPFFLGNRTKIGTVHDFDDPAWKFPTCHDLFEVYDMHDQPAKLKGLESPSTHMSHAIAMGVWLVMGNLTQLAAFFLMDENLALLLPLRSGQLMWICQQYLRNLSLLSVKWTSDSSLEARVLTGVRLPPEEDLIAAARRCVQRVLQGLQMTGDS
ncbi:hypothetical protein AUEXF2481DRAFT_44840 [Aureobasidium subglaciale EXF-2481]|uniref:Zn(2)-C6 fungal-type domain-containing protein n=1 Tax=Aureobasidium subglaciale (strain EXF-2481) TaxID=1043005 RepID=A0A074YV81_AURSE|nr:uncharacterized protein AUEXF2481DRAFT_44840 [Aureobasidium subglaciale EXF-2481]KEQ90791.1 hypothetical protein AUEXF2481DRAFT_44840 [Aureobasidium subglaciale EXF-2481]